MSKRVYRFALCSYYNKDFFSVNFLSCKTINFLRYKKKKYDARIERYRNLRKIYGKKFNKKKLKRSFSFRTDRPNPKKKRRRFKFYSFNLGYRQMMRTFATQMNLTKFRKISNYLSCSGRISSDFFYFFECRIDLILYRLNFFTSSFQSRQTLNHGFAAVNGYSIYSSSFIVKKFDFISFQNKKRAYKILKNRFKRFLIICNTPFFLITNYRLMEFMYVFLPKHHKFYYYPLKMRNLIRSLGKRFAFY